MEAYEYIICQSPNEDEHEISLDDAHDGLHEDVSPSISPIQNGDRRSLDDVSSDPITPSTSMLHNTNEEHKAPQLEGDLIYINLDYMIIFLWNSLS